MHWKSTTEIVSGLLTVYKICQNAKTTYKFLRFPLSKSTWIIAMNNFQFAMCAYTSKYSVST